jgi:hypothetical protein
MSNDAGAAGRAMRQSPDVVSNRLGDAGVLVNLRTNRIFELNATGVRAWELMGEGCTIGEIQRRLGEEFDVAPDRVERELTALVDALVREGLVDVDAAR